VLVSVLINNFNYSKYIEQCIDSVLQQTYKNIEIIVYDDGSTDESLQILEKYCNQITIIAQKNYGRTPNQNQANAIYQAFLQSKGDIICLLDSDDAFYNNKVEKVVEAFARQERACVVQHVMLEINEENKRLENIRPVLKDVEDIRSYIYSNHSLFHLFVATSGLSFKRALLHKILPLKEDEKAYVWADARLMLQSVFYGDIVSIREPLTYYRVHGSNDSSARGSFEGHSQYLQQIFEFFNYVAAEHGHEPIIYDYQLYLKNTFFYTAINQGKLLTFCQNIMPSDVIYIWGAGEAGQSASHVLKENKIIFSGFIDSDKRKQNKTIENMQVHNPESIGFTENIKIIVSPYHAYDAIKHNLQQKGLIEGTHFIDPYKR